MLSREHRYPFFQGVPENTYTTAYFTLRYRKRDGGGIRCAVVVGKKVHNLSNIRNRVKRVFTEKLAETMENWDASYDLVFYLKKAVLDDDVEVWERSIRESLKKLGVVQ